MTRWLVLRLHAPLAAFGGEAIDAHGVTRDFPALSAVTGLLANALGVERYERGRLQALQDRIVFAARRDLDPASGRLTDFQTAKLGKSDRGWTTHLRVEGRDGGDATYDSPHIRYRDHHADARLTLVLTLLPPEGEPTLDAIAAALDRPERPLFIGRKPCLPTRPLLDGSVEAATAVAALYAAAPLAPHATGPLRAIWPAGAEGPTDPVDRIVDITDERNWRTGLHGGARRVALGRLSPERRTS